MAPLAVEIADLALSSLELDARAFTPHHLAKRDDADDTGSFLSDVLEKRDEDGRPLLSPVETFETLTARDTDSTTTINPASGSINPDDINMKAIQAVFAIIGASLVIGGIWFFFWAKNGGFQWRENDWEEYKSTVLRRKGPNGTTLSNATKSTKLGGGSVVGQGFSDDGSTSWEGTNTVTDLSSVAPPVASKEKKSRKQKRANAKAAKIREVREEKWEGGHDEDMRAYRQEQPARVGGMNKNSDSQYYGTDYASSDQPDARSHSQRTSWQPQQPTPPEYSSRRASPEERRSKRDFSHGNDAQYTAASRQHSSDNATKPNRYRSSERPTRSSRVPGGYDHDGSTDHGDLQSQNTKSYRHPLSTTPKKGGAARAKSGGVSGGYRRDRRNSLDD